MKKIPFVCLILAICLLFALPAPALAADTAQTETDSHIFLTNPVAIASVQGNLFVADNLESNHSVVFCFDVSGAEPVKTIEKEFDKQIVNIAEVDGKLAVIYKNEIETYSVTSNQLIAADTYNVGGALDVAYGAMKTNSGDGSTFAAISYISSNKAQFKGAGNWTDVFETPNGHAVTFFDGYFYYAYNGKVKRDDGLTPTNDQFNAAFDADGNSFKPTGIVTYQLNGAQKMALFDATSACAVDFDNYTATASLFADVKDVDGNIVDLCFASGKLFALNSNKRVKIFAENSDHTNFVITNYAIGTDTISITPPTEFTGFTLAKSLGYPTNIIYKTVDDAADVNIVTDCKDQFIILDFEGAANLKYYYVMYGNRFGWVRKSVGASTPQQDAKIEVINNNVGTAGVKYTSKFASLNAVYVYSLPRSDSPYADEFNQKADSMVQFTFLQSFDEVKTDGKTVTWFYIEYVNPKTEQTMRGFIPEGTFGNIVGEQTKSDQGIECFEQKINSSLFEAVKIYLTESMASGQEISDSEGIIKLYSGTYVNAIEIRGLATYVQVYHHGKYVYGWVPTANLIDTNKLTTNAIVGISLLADAAVLGITLTVVFVERRKRRRRKAEKEAQAAESLENN